MDINQIEIKRSEPNFGKRFMNILKRIICLILPIGFAFGGYFTSPYIWMLLNHSDKTPEYFSFICALLFFTIPSVVIFIESRKLNPTIKITIKDKVTESK